MAGSTNYRPDAQLSQANTLEYVIGQQLMNVNTILPCTVIAIDPTNTYFTILPLLNYIDVNGAPISPPYIYDVPKLDVVGNNAGIIIEYAVGDKVGVGFVQRDITNLKINGWTQTNPNSYRKFSLSDAIIISHISVTPPVVYIKIAATGISIEAVGLPVNVTAASVTIDSGNINLGVGGIGVLNGNTVMQVENAASGSTTLPVTIVSGISTTVKATN